MFFDIVAIEVSCPFFLCEIAITTLDTSHYELHGVHHIHYNKDYNPSCAIRCAGSVYTISIITRITTTSGAGNVGSAVYTISIITRITTISFLFHLNFRVYTISIITRITTLGNETIDA